MSASATVATSLAKNESRTQVRSWAGWSNRLNALAAEITKQQPVHDNP